MKGYEIFIAYRRSESVEVAERIYEALIKRGYETFLDIQELGGGNFREKNLPEIANSVINYIVILTDKSFDRCIEDEEDLFGNGIEFALSHGKRVVPVFLDKVGFPENLPERISDIKNCNALTYEKENFEEFLNKLIKKFLVDKNQTIISDPERDFDIEDGVLVEYLGMASKVIIPDEVKIIGENAFKDKTKVEEIIFPQGLKEIRAGAFERCIGIYNINLPDDVEKVGDRVFSRCYKLSYIKLGRGLSEIGDYAFSYCCRLKWILLPPNLQFIPGSAFNGCSLLYAIFVDEKNNYFVSHDGILYDYEMTSLIRCPENYDEDYIDIKQTVTVIKAYAFYRCMNVQQINLPKKLKVIEGHSFEGCCNITNIMLSEFVESFDVTAVEGWEDDQQIKFSNKFSPKKRKEIENQLKKIEKEDIKNREYEFVIIKTTFESLEEAKNMANMLLKFKYIVSGQIHQLESMYLWEHELNDEYEYELACITISKKCDKAMDFIHKNHSYETCQILVVPIPEVSDEIADWLYDSLEEKRC